MTRPPITFPRAVSLAIAEYDRPVVTAYHLGVLVYRLVRAGHIEGQTLREFAPAGGDGDE